MSNDLFLFDHFSTREANFRTGIFLSPVNYIYAFLVDFKYFSVPQFEMSAGYRPKTEL